MYAKKHLEGMLTAYSYEYMEKSTNQLCRAIELSQSALEMTGHKFSSELNIELEDKTVVSIPQGDFITSDFQIIPRDKMLKNYTLVSKINHEPKKGLSLSLVEETFNPTFGSRHPHLPKSSRPSPVRYTAYVEDNSGEPEVAVNLSLKDRIALNRPAANESTNSFPIFAQKK